MRQSTSHIFLVRPASFNYNAQTAASNAFQNKIGLAADTLQKQALAEFDNFAKQLIDKGVNVTIVEDTENPPKPDAIFPNNWGTFHSDGTVILYPVAAPNRRLEKRAEILELLKKRYKIQQVIDLSKYEEEEKYLEGTGSIVFDHIQKIAYAGLSPRTHQKVLLELCNLLGYKPVVFTATDQMGTEIYHTNVMMCVSEKFAVVCLESIKDLKEQEMVIHSLEETGHEIIEITQDQLVHFAGNMLSVYTKDGNELLVMSQSAFNFLNDDQRDAIESYCEPLPVDISTIETVGGGSARCMIAEVFLMETE